MKLFSAVCFASLGWLHMLKVSDNKVQAFEMWMHRRIPKMPWSAALHSMNKTLEMLNAIKRRKLQYFKHLRHNNKYH